MNDTMGQNCPLTTSTAAIMKAIWHPKRLQIIYLLKESEMTVGEIHKALKTSKTNISQHLTILRNRNVVESYRKINFIYNRISDPKIIELMNSLDTIFELDAKNEKKGFC